MFPFHSTQAKASISRRNHKENEVFWYMHVLMPVLALSSFSMCACAWSVATIEESGWKEKRQERAERKNWPQWNKITWQCMSHLLIEEVIGKRKWCWQKLTNQRYLFNGLSWKKKKPFQIVSDIFALHIFSLTMNQWNFGYEKVYLLLERSQLTIRSHFRPKPNLSDGE